MSIMFDKFLFIARGAGENREEHIMQISRFLNKDEIIEIQKQFYEYFKTGYEFEEFLKDYLIKMGLDEVEVTQRTRDGGIDLTAIRKGVGDFSDVDITNYYIQAKRYALSRKVKVTAIRELRGTIPSGHKGIIITTSSFTDDAKNESRNDSSRPIVLIDGKNLVLSCIDNEIGFVFKPIFSEKQMDLFLNKSDIGKKQQDKSSKIDFKDYIEKTITANDIRARIVSIPSSIIKRIDNDLNRIDVLINKEKSYNFSINRSRNYFGGVTQFFKDYNFITDEGVIILKKVNGFMIKRILLT